MTSEICKALVTAQRNFAPALKTATNPHFKSKYADLSACVEAVLDALNDAGIMLMQKCHPCDDGVLVETMFIHESGEQLSAGKLHVPAAKSDPQGYGSALTYARRYSLMAACGIAPEDDDGNAAKNAATNRPDESEIADCLIAINDSDDMESLKTVFADCYRRFEHNKFAVKKLTDAKDKRKNELLGEQA